MWYKRKVSLLSKNMQQFGNGMKYLKAVGVHWATGTKDCLDDNAYYGTPANKKKVKTKLN